MQGLRGLIPVGAERGRVNSPDKSCLLPGDQCPFLCWSLKSCTVCYSNLHLLGLTSLLEQSFMLELGLILTLCFFPPQQEWGLTFSWYISK